MDTLIQVYRDGEWFIAIDLATNVADQGKTKEEAISRLKTGLKEHYEVLLEMIEKDRNFEIITVEVPNCDNSSSPLIA
jgi:predicted RNase H-like HicB family nuclease